MEENNKSQNTTSTGTKQAMQATGIFISVGVGLVGCFFMFIFVLALDHQNFFEGFPGIVSVFLAYGLILAPLIGAIIYSVARIKNQNTPNNPYIKTSSVRTIINSKFSSSITPVLNSIIKNDLDSVRTVLQGHPGQLNTAYAQNGNTPLHVAALNGYTDIVRLLLEQPGIDTARTNNEGKTALDLAREKGCTEVVQLLENK